MQKYRIPLHYNILIEKFCSSVLTSIKDGLILEYFPLQDAFYLSGPFGCKLSYEAKINGKLYLLEAVGDQPTLSEKYRFYAAALNLVEQYINIMFEHEQTDVITLLKEMAFNNILCSNNFYVENQEEEEDEND